MPRGSHVNHKEMEIGVQVGSELKYISLALNKFSFTAYYKLPISK